MRVLVATDGSAHALAACRFLVTLAGTAQAEVEVMTVLSYELYPYSLVAGEHLPAEAEMAAAVGVKVDETISAAKKMLVGAGYAVTVNHRFGNAGDEILAEIAECQPDLVVIGKRGLHGLQRVIGSVSEHVIHRCPVPILVVP